MKMVNKISWLFISLVISSFGLNSAHAADPAVLDVGEIPEFTSLPIFPEYTEARRKLKGGGQELCRFSNEYNGVLKQMRRPDCYPVLSGQAAQEYDCSGANGWEGDERFGSMRPSCVPKKRMVNMQSPFDACRTVRLTEEDAHASDEIRTKAYVAAACEIVNRPTSAWESLSQAIRSQPWYKYRGTPQLPLTSQTDEVKSLVDFAILAGKKTQEYLNISLDNNRANVVCLERVRDAAAKISREEKLGGSANVTAATHKDKLEALASPACVALQTQIEKDYKEQLPKMRSLMLLHTGGQPVGPSHANTAGENVFWPNETRLVINTDMRAGGDDVILPSNTYGRNGEFTGFAPADVGNIEYDRPTEAETQQALATYRGWLAEIDKEWDRMHPPGTLPRVKKNRELGSRFKFDVPNSSTLTPMDTAAGQEIAAASRLQTEWEKFAAAQIRQRREKVKKEYQSQMMAHPVFQGLASNNPQGYNGYLNAYATLQRRLTEAADKVQLSINRGQKELKQYMDAMELFRQGKGEKPKEPSISDLREIIAAKGTLNQMVANDTRLCAAATMYWDGVARMNTGDAVVEMGALVGISLATGGIASFGMRGAMVAGQAASAGTVAGLAAGVAASWAINHAMYTAPVEQRDLAYNMLASCVQQATGPCKSPGDLQHYLESQEGTKLGWVNFVPFMNGEGLLLKAMGIGSMLAGARMGSKIAENMRFPWMSKEGKLNYEAIFAALKRGDRAFFDVEPAGFKKFMGEFYAKMFGTADPSVAQKHWAENLLRAYNTKNGVFMTAALKSDPAAFMREMEVLGDLIREISKKEGVHLGNADKLATLLRLMQDPVTGIAAPDPKYVRSILRTGYLDLATGNTPEETLRMLKEWVSWGVKNTGGNFDHLAGLDLVKERTLNNLRAKFAAANRGIDWDKALPSQRERWLQMAQRNPAMVEEARMKALVGAVQDSKKADLLVAYQDSRRTELLAGGRYTPDEVSAKLASQEEQNLIRRQVEAKLASADEQKSIQEQARQMALCDRSSASAFKLGKN